MDYDDLVDQFIEHDSNSKSDCSNNSNNNNNNNNTVTTPTSITTASTSTASTAASTLPVAIHKAQLSALRRERDLRRKMFTLEYVKRRNATIASSLQTPSSAPSKPPTTLTLANPATQERRRQVLNLALNASPSADLIPCRLELDHDGYKLSDVLLLEEGCSAEAIDLLAAQLTTEYDLPADPFTPVLSKFLREQVDEFGVFKQALAATPIPFAELPALGMRIDIIVGLTRLQDRIELALNCGFDDLTALVKHYSVPELSAEELKPFKPLLLHNLLEQLLMWKKALVFGGWHRDARTGALKLHDPEANAAMHESNVTAVRRHPSAFSAFTPQVTALSPAELDKIESSRERESRRKRRTQAPPSLKGSKQLTPLVNPLTGSIRSPPRTLPTPTSYRGSLHRVVQSKLVDDDESGSGTGGGAGRGKRRK